MRTSVTVAAASVLFACLPALAGAAESVSEVAGTPAPGVAPDPNSDRGFLLPTALTQPAGTVTYNNYELLLHGITYGITDNLQVTATAVSPITRDMPFYGNLAVKSRLWSNERLHLALQGSAGYGHIFGGSDDLVTLGSGAFASLCLRDDCSSLLSASVGYQFGLATAGGDGMHLVVYGASLVQRLSTHVKLLLEIDSAAASETGRDLEHAPGLLANYGLRFANDRFAGDVGFMKPVAPGENDDDEFILGFPFANFSYRF